MACGRRGRGSDMLTLKRKIKETALFSDEDKIAILTRVDTYPVEETTKLETIIDEFDATHKAAVSEYKASVYGVLDDIVKKSKPEDKKRFQSASSTIRSGVEMILL